MTIDLTKPGPYERIWFGRSPPIPDYIPPRDLAPNVWHNITPGVGPNGDQVEARRVDYFDGGRNIVSRMYDLNGNFLHEEVTTIMDPPKPDAGVGSLVNTHVARCKTCKWHDRPTCTNPKLNESGEPWSDAPDALTYSYSEGGGFSTGDDFGCVHHEPKDA